MNAFEVQGIITAGGSVDVDAADYSTFDLQGFARMLRPGARLTIKNSERLNAFDRRGLALAKPGQVDFK